MSSTESKRRFDFDTDLVRLHFFAVMCAMNDEASGMHRHKSTQTLRHPVGSFDRFDGQGARGFAVGGAFEQRAQGFFVRCVAEMNCQLPTAVVVLEGGAGCIVGIEAFAEKRRQPAGGGFIAKQAGNGGGGRSWPDS